MPTLADLLIRVRGDGEQFRQDISKDQKEVNDLVANMDKIHDVLAKVNVDDQESTQKVRELRQQIAEIRNETAKVDVTTEDGQAKLNELRAKLAGIRDETVHIHVSDADAILKINNIRAQLDAMSNQPGPQPSNPANNNNAQQAAAGGAALAGVIMGLLPLLSPLVASTAAGVMGLASAFGAASVGAIGFGAVAKSNLTDIFTAQKNLTAAQQAYDNATNSKQRQAALLKEKKAVEDLNGEQMKALKSLQDFQSFWKNFTQSFQNPVLDLFTGALTNLQVILNDLKPAIQAAASAFQQMGGELTQSLGSTDIKGFFDMLKMYTGTTLYAFGDAFGNTFRAIMNLMVEFAPVGEQMAFGLLHLSQAFLNWTQSFGKSQDFKNFMSYFETNGPKVWDLIKNLASAIVNILIDMAPMGAVFLTVIDNFSKFLNTLTKTNPALTQIIMGAVAATGAFLLLKNPITGAITGFQSFIGVLGKMKTALFGVQAAEEGVAVGEEAMNAANPIGWIILIITALGILVYEVVTHWSQIVDSTTNAWSSISDFFTGLWEDISSGVSDFLDGLGQWFLNEWASITQTTTSIWNHIKDFFRKWGLDLLGFVLGGPIGVLVVEIIKHWNQISTETTQIFNDIINFVEGIWNDFVSWITNAAQSMANGVINAFSWLYQHNYYFKDLVDGIRNLWVKAESDATAIWNAITGFLSSSWNTIKNTALSVFSSISSFLSSTWDGIRSSATWWLDSISSTVSNFAHRLYNDAAGPIGHLGSFFSWLWDSIRSSASWWWDSLRSTVSYYANEIYNWAADRIRPIASFLSNTWDAIRSSAAWWWGSIRSHIVNAVDSAVSGVRNYFGNLGSEAWHWGRNMLDGFVNGIESMIGRVRSVASSVTSAVARFLGFHSPSEEGEGQHIVEWGENMIGGFMDGIKNATPKLHALMNGVIKAPTMSVSPGVANMLNGKAGSGNSQVTHNWNLTIENANMRSEADIQKLAYQLQRFQQQKLGSIGG